VTALWLIAALYASVFVMLVIVGKGGVDSHAYWVAWKHPLYLHAAPGRGDAYLYSPLFAQVLKPLTLLPWPVFGIMWAGLIAAVYAWLLAPVGPRWGVLWIALVIPDVVYGNVFSLFALVLVWGVRYPGLWAFPLLTKVTPGLGVVWFAFRREWRSLAVALGTTASVAAFSIIFAPHLWVDWVKMMISSGGHPVPNPVVPLSLPVFVRLPVALGLVAVAARKNRYTLLAPAMALATPVFGPACFAVLAALPRLRAEEHRRRSTAADANIPDSDAGSRLPKATTWSPLPDSQ
jgi:hypothetical protein